MDAAELSFEQKLDLIRLMVELRQAPPLGVVGLLELRNLLSDLFSEFAAVRDAELDDLIREYADSLASSVGEVPSDVDFDSNPI